MIGVKLAAVANMQTQDCKFARVNEKCESTEVLSALCSSSEQKYTNLNISVSSVEVMGCFHGGVMQKNASRCC